MHVSDEFRTLLLDLAVEMAVNGARERRFEAVDGEGRITTDYQSVTLGCRGGLAFEADVSSEDGDFRVQFFVDDRYLRESRPGTWITLPSSPLGASSHSEMLN
jgi:hypothetical protein